MMQPVNLCMDFVLKKKNSYDKDGYGKSHLCILGFGYGNVGCSILSLKGN